MGKKKGATSRAAARAARSRPAVLPHVATIARSLHDVRLLGAGNLDAAAASASSGSSGGGTLVGAALVVALAWYAALHRRRRVYSYHGRAFEAGEGRALCE